MKKLNTNYVFDDVKELMLTSSQDKGIGRHTSPPRTKIRRITINIKTKNKNCQKIKLYGNPTIKELKKKHSSRPAGGVETGSQVERTRSKAVAGGSGEAVAGGLSGPTFVCR